MLLVLGVAGRAGAVPVVGDLPVLVCRECGSTDQKFAAIEHRKIETVQ